MALPPKWYQFLVSLFASLGSYLYGYDLGVIAEVIASANFKNKFNATDVQQGIVVSLFTGGAFCGAFFGGPAGDTLGRRITIIIGSVFFLLGGGLQTGASSLEFLYSGRFFAGFGVGMLVMIIPLYQAELAHPSIRGRVTALQQFMLGIGALVASWVSYATYTYMSATNSAQWRLPLGLQMVPAVFLAALIFLFPESPRWLIDHGRSDEGLRNLAKLHAHGNVNDPWVVAEYTQIRDQIEFEHEHEAKSYVELFTNRASFRRVFLTTAIQASIQMTGVSAIQYYSVQIYALAGIAGSAALKYQAINSIIALIAQFLCILLIDKFGRRWVLINGNLVNMACFLVACIMLAVFPVNGKNSTAGTSWGFIIVTWVYNFSFSFACGPLSWIIPAEVFDTRTRSKGVSIATMVSFAFNTLIGQVTPIAMTNVGYRYYILFIICNFTNAVFFWAFLPETKLIPLEEMNALFTNSPWFVPGTKRENYLTHDLEHRVEEVERKNSTVGIEDYGHDDTARKY